MKRLCLAGWVAVVAFFSWTVGASAATLFAENFEGYTSFPSQAPSGDYINAGIARVSEGAQGVWYAGRFEKPDGGSIDSDLAIQKYGGGSNMSHTGRVEGDAGMLFQLNTVGYANVALSFDWRTFQAETNDRFVVGYYVGNLNFGACTGNGEAGCFRDFYNSDFGGNQNAAVSWWNTQWTAPARRTAGLQSRTLRYRRTSGMSGWRSGWITAKRITPSLTTSGLRPRRFPFPQRRGCSAQGCWG